MEDISIRELTPQENIDDRNLLLPAFLDIWNHPDNLTYLTFTLKPFEQEEVRFWLENHKDQKVRYFCALSDDGVILGIAVLKTDPIEGFELFGLGVRPGFKQQGIGRRLIERTLDSSAEQGFKAVNTSVFADNSAMLRLLLSCTFVPAGMDFHKWADGADSVRMIRHL